jgi:hypothetical protein
MGAIMNMDCAIEITENQGKSPDRALNLLTLQKESAASNLTIGEGFGLPLLTLEPFPGISQELDKNSCDAFPATKTQKDSLAATVKGESGLNRLYELAVLTPAGKVTPKAFEKVYGKTIADKLTEMGIKEIDRNGDTIAVSLKKPLHFGDDSGSVDIASAVSFTSRPAGGKALLDNISGVTAKSGIFEVDVSRVDLQPRAKGYLTALITAGPSEATVCAVPDGRIFH